MRSREERDVSGEEAGEVSSGASSGAKGERMRRERTTEGQRSQRRTKPTEGERRARQKAKSMEPQRHRGVGEGNLRERSRVLVWGRRVMELGVGLLLWSLACVGKGTELERIHRWQMAVISIEWRLPSEIGERGQVQATAQLSPPPEGVALPALGRCYILLKGKGSVQIDTANGRASSPPVQWSEGEQLKVQTPFVVARVGYGTVALSLWCKLQTKEDIKRYGSKYYARYFPEAKGILGGIDGKVYEVGGSSKEREYPYQIRIRLGRVAATTGKWEEAKQEGDRAKFVAYLPKEARLDFDARTLLKVEYGPSKVWNVVEAFKYAPPGPRWWVEGGMGSITQEGVFTAERFGKGKVCVAHGVLEDCLEVEVVPHPKPSPPDKIVDIVVVPYDTPQERAHVEKVLKENKEKPFKSKEEAHRRLNKERAYKVKYKVKDAFGEREHIADELIIHKGKKNRFLALPVNAIGKVVPYPSKRSKHYAYLDSFDCQHKGIDNAKQVLPKLKHLPYRPFLLIGNEEQSCEITASICTDNHCYTASRYKVRIVP